MSFDPAIIRSSFSFVVDQEPELARRFYEILFERYPQAKPLFGRNTGAAQQAMLTQALAAVVAHVEDEEWLRITLTTMGARHVGYGVTDEMYDWVGASLLATLAEVAGSAWTPELAAAWTEVYGVVASTMQAGAHAVTTAAA